MKNELQTIKTDIYKDGKLLKSIEGADSGTKAFGWLLRNQSCSVDRALKIEGYSVTETKTDGTTEKW